MMTSAIYDLFAGAAVPEPIIANATSPIGLTQPKTGDQRVIQLSSDLLRIFEEASKTSKWVFTAPPTKMHPRTDRQVSDRRALAHLKSVLKKLGLPGHLHTFRHSFISHALTGGIPEPIVRTWVGHVDHEIVKHYTHVADRQSRSAMDQILPGQLGSHGGDG